MSEESSTKLSISLPDNVTQVHMIYGDAEKDGLLSKCITVDITSSLIPVDIVTGSQLKVIHIWYKPPLTTHVKCTQIIYYVNGDLPEEHDPEVHSSMYYDTLDGAAAGAGLGANIALDEPNIANDCFNFEPLDRCGFCSWSGSWYDMDNHYMEFHANKEVVMDPYDHFDHYFPN